MTKILERKDNIFYKCNYLTFYFIFLDFKKKIPEILLFFVIILILLIIVS